MSPTTLGQAVRKQKIKIYSFSSSYAAHGRYYFLPPTETSNAFEYGTSIHKYVVVTHDRRRCAQNARAKIVGTPLVISRREIRLETKNRTGKKKQCSRFERGERLRAKILSTKLLGDDKIKKKEKGEK